MECLQELAVRLGCCILPPPSPTTPPWSPLMHIDSDSDWEGKRVFSPEPQSWTSSPPPGSPVSHRLPPRSNKTST
uniref:Uncharacterized protein n=1 Tax=viral metagenome TaxID=1070528 RepID=A0A6C0BPT9_9ZZZZ